jgi:hypothetical protein
MTVLRTVEPNAPRVERPRLVAVERRACGVVNWTRTTRARVQI